MHKSAPEAIDWQAEVAAEQTRVEIPQDRRESFARSTTLRAFYDHGQYGPFSKRLADVLRGTLAASTVTKDRQALSRFERFSPRPAAWPEGEQWLGRPLAFITDEHLDETFAAMRAALALDTCRSTWSHLRAILQAAVDVRALDRVPAVNWPKRRGDEAAARELYHDEDLGRVYEALAGDVDLQVAFVLAVNVGARAVDLFGLRWECFDLDGDRPAVEFTARKTGKRHRVPLAPVTVAQVERWRDLRPAEKLLPGFETELRGPLFPKLQAQEAKEPEQSRPARARNRRMKARLAAIGLRFGKPWQVARVTCNERLERHKPGVGQFVLGHANTLNARSYREPSGEIFAAITTLPQPAAFRLDQEGPE